MIEQRLLQRLQERATRRGIVPVPGSVLAKEIGEAEEEIGMALDRLERAGLLRILAPLPFLVLRLRSWSGKSARPADHLPPAYSYSKLSRTNESKSYRPGVGNALMRDILDTLGETDPTSFEGAIRNYPSEVIRKALDRVRRTHAVRKNRTALFRYLLTKLS